LSDQHIIKQFLVINIYIPFLKHLHHHKKTHTHQSLKISLSLLVPESKHRKSKEYIFCITLTAFLDASETGAEIYRVENSIFQDVNA
jgi:hypothetical protein